MQNEQHQANDQTTDSARKTWETPTMTRLHVDHAESGPGASYDGYSYNLS